MKFQSLGTFHLSQPCIYRETDLGMASLIIYNHDMPHMLFHGPWTYNIIEVFW